MEPTVKTNARLALLYNFLPPYRIMVFQEIQKSVSALRVILSVPMEKNRHWSAEFGDLDVVIQKTITKQYVSHSPNRFSTELSCHFPLDTLKLLRDFRPDVILSLEFGMRTLQAALYALVHPKVKLIIWAHVSEVTELARGRARRLLRKLLLQTASVVLVNGSSGRRYIESLGFPGNRILVVPKTTDIELFKGKPVRTPQAATRLLYVGRLIELKGLEPFLNQLAAWAERNPQHPIVLTLLGSGPLREKVEARLMPANLQLKILSEVSYREVPNHYKEADIFVFPTLADEWGLVVNEAMIAGLPVLGSIYSQAVEELVVPEVNGWVFHTDNAEEMYSCIDMALKTPPDELGHMRRSAIETIEPLTPRFIADCIVKVIVAAAEA